jgi:hypothetical protein
MMEEYEVGDIATTACLTRDFDLASMLDPAKFHNGFPLLMVD